MSATTHRPTRAASPELGAHPPEPTPPGAVPVAMATDIEESPMISGGRAPTDDTHRRRRALDGRRPEGGVPLERPVAGEDPLERHRGRFSEGQEVLGEEDPQKHHRGRFSEGQEVLGEEDPQKHHRGRFSEGQEVLGEEDPEKHRQGSFADGERGGEL